MILGWLRQHMSWTKEQVTRMTKKKENDIVSERKSHSCTNNLWPLLTTNRGLSFFCTNTIMLNIKD